MLEDIDYAINSGGLTESSCRPVPRQQVGGTGAQSAVLPLRGNLPQIPQPQPRRPRCELLPRSGSQGRSTKSSKRAPTRSIQTGHPEKDYLMLFAQTRIGQRRPTSIFWLSSSTTRLGVAPQRLGLYAAADAGTAGPHPQVHQYLSDGQRHGASPTNPAGRRCQFIEETDGRDPRLAQSIRTPGYTRIGQTDSRRRRCSETTVTGYQPVKFVQDPTSNSNNNDRVDSSDCDMPVYRLRAKCYFDLCRSQGRTGHAHAGRPHDLHQQT